MSFKWEKLKYWNIGHNIYEVIAVHKIPDKYNDLNTSPRIRENEVVRAVIDTELKKIFMLDKCFTSPEYFLENLFHEIEHALDDEINLSDINDLAKEIESEDYLEMLDELRNDLNAKKHLEMLRNNIKNYVYILDYYENRNKTKTKTRRKK